MLYKGKVRITHDINVFNSLAFPYGKLDTLGLSRGCGWVNAVSLLLVSFVDYCMNNIIDPSSVVVHIVEINHAHFSPWSRKSLVCIK